MAIKNHTLSPKRYTPACDIVQNSPKKAKWLKITFWGSESAPKVSGGVRNSYRWMKMTKSGPIILIWVPEVPFDLFSAFWGGALGKYMKIFNCNSTYLNDILF